jgi:hypothetical protein
VIYRFFCGVPGYLKQFNRHWQILIFSLLQRSPITAGETLKSSAIFKACSQDSFVFSPSENAFSRIAFLRCSMGILPENEWPVSHIGDFG